MITNNFNTNINFLKFRGFDKRILYLEMEVVSLKHVKVLIYP